MVVRRSAIRLTLIGVAGLLLILTSIDLLGGHWVSRAPESNPVNIEEPDGATQLTSRGQVTARTQKIWGYSFAIVGGACVLGAIVALSSSRPLARVDGDGIHLRLAGPGRPLSTIPWKSVVSVRSGVDETEARVLFIELDEVPGDLPADPWDARWHGRTLTTFTDTWTPPGEVVAAEADLILQSVTANSN
ncbi:MAG: hypothetical protein KJP12_03590 [Acidimicrobiia bacterium]|nr:hypothetical protein [Acidimicrobiia bacterium]